MVNCWCAMQHLISDQHKLDLDRLQETISRIRLVVEQIKADADSLKQSCNRDLLIERHRNSINSIAVRRRAAIIIQRRFRKRSNNQLLKGHGRGQSAIESAKLNCSIESASSSTQRDQPISAAIHRTYTTAIDDKDPELGQCTTPSPLSSDRVESRLQLTRLSVRTLPNVAITADPLIIHHLDNGLVSLSPASSRRESNCNGINKSPSSSTIAPTTNPPPKSLPKTTSKWSSCFRLKAIVAGFKSRLERIRSKRRSLYIRC